LVLAPRSANRAVDPIRCASAAVRIEAGHRRGDHELALGRAAERQRADRDRAGAGPRHRVVVLDAGQDPIDVAGGYPSRDPGGDESGPVGQPGEAVGRERIDQSAGGSTSRVRATSPAAMEVAVIAGYP
jgi:hypothetical protein